MTAKSKGNLTELQCISAFYELGYSVSIPYGENSRYDFIADIHGKLIRVQSKTCRKIEDGCLVFSCRSTRLTASGCLHRRYTANEADYFATFFDGMCYLIPVCECGSEKKLRISESKNNQKAGINYARDYELPLQVRVIDKERE